MPVRSDQLRPAPARPQRWAACPRPGWRGARHGDDQRGRRRSAGSGDRRRGRAHLGQGGLVPRRVTSAGRMNGSSAMP